MSRTAPLPHMPPTTHAPRPHRPPGHACPPPCTPPTTHTPWLCTPPRPCTTPPRGQNHGRLWKYNLAPTSLRAVKIQLIQLIRQQKIRIKRLVRFELTTCWSSVRHRSHFSDGSRISQTGKGHQPLSLGNNLLFGTTYTLILALSQFGSPFK